jgi:hypothetical protein
MLRFVPTGGNIGRIDMAGLPRESTANLTGTWHGQYTYPCFLQPVFFVATLLESASRIDGTIEEPLRGTSEMLYAVIAGRRSGGAVTFLKTYQNAPLGYGVVNYGGTLNADHTEIEGTWQIPRNWFGLFLSWSGKFLMIRDSGVEESVAREVAEFV